MNAVAYMRCSGRSQVEGDSFPRQIAAILSYCQNNQIELIYEYREEAVPGKLDEEHRPAFQKMIEDLKQRTCQIIIIESMSRLAREYRTQEHLITLIASEGFTLIAADTGEDITASMMGDPMRRALIQIQGIFSELEKNVLVQKLKKARDRKRLTGVRIEGKIPFGGKPGENNTLEEIKSLRQSGNSPSQIAKILNTHNFQTREGKPWHPGTVAKILSRIDKS